MNIKRFYYELFQHKLELVISFIVLLGIPLTLLLLQQTLQIENRAANIDIVDVEVSLNGGPYIDSLTNRGRTFQNVCRGAIASVKLTIGPNIKNPATMKFSFQDNGNNPVRQEFLGEDPDHPSNPPALTATKTSTGIITIPNVAVGNIIYLKFKNNIGYNTMVASITGVPGGGGSEFELQTDDQGCGPTPPTSITPSPTITQIPITPSPSITGTSPSPSQTQLTPSPSITSSISPSPSITSSTSPSPSVATTPSPSVTTQPTTTVTLTPTLTPTITPTGEPAVPTAIPSNTPTPTQTLLADNTQTNQTMYTTQSTTNTTQTRSTNILPTPTTSHSVVASYDENGNLIYTNQVNTNNSSNNTKKYGSVASSQNANNPTIAPTGDIKPALGIFGAIIFIFIIGVSILVL